MLKNGAMSNNARNLDIEVFSAFAEQKRSPGNAALDSVFQTTDQQIFIRASQHAYKGRSEFGGFKMVNPSTAQSEKFPFDVIVLKMGETEKQDLREKYAQIWNNAIDPGKLYFEQRIQPHTPDLFFMAAEGLSPDENMFLTRRMETLDRELKEIIGSKIHSRFIAMPNFEYHIGAKGHPPSHPHAVLNETWMQDGLVLTNEDGEHLGRMDEGDKVFMLPGTRHSPPPVKAENGEVSPRYSLIANECA